MKNHISVKQHKKEYRAAGFKCLQCRVWVPFNEFMGTQHRNHCFYCLWSKHVDDKTPGDRLSECHGGMEPVALTYKRARIKQYPELMIVHICCNCGKISPNRLAADDMGETIWEIFNKSLEMRDEMREVLQSMGIDILVDGDEELVRVQI